MTLPHAASVGALYDDMLLSALRQFFERASVERETGASTASNELLAIEPSANPAALIVRLFGRRYTLRVPERWVFTAHEVRLARAIGAVLSARYRAILTPDIIARRDDLFRGAIEDRYVGAFLDHRPYEVEEAAARADRIASIIELLRVAALSSYENRSISTGVLFLNGLEDPCRSPSALPVVDPPAYAESLTSIKSFYRLADGVNTLFVANSEGRLLDVIDIERWAGQVCEPRALHVPCSKTYQSHARATLQHGHVCAVLSPAREIKIFSEGAEVFAFRGAGWHLLDLQSKYRVWSDAVGNERVAMRLFQTALDLAERREGALFVVVREPSTAVTQLLAPSDRLDVPLENPAEAPSRRDLLHMLERRSATDLDPTVPSSGTCPWTT